MSPLCACGHGLHDHKQDAVGHGWHCWGEAMPATKPCECEGCRSNGAPSLCACRRFRAVKPEAPAAETSGAL